MKGKYDNLLGKLSYLTDLPHSVVVFFRFHLRQLPTLVVQTLTAAFNHLCFGDVKKVQAPVVPVPTVISPDPAQLEMQLVLAKHQFVAVSITEWGILCELRLMLIRSRTNDSAFRGTCYLSRNKEFQHDSTCPVFDVGRFNFVGNAG